MITLTRQDLEDMLNGAAVFGAGGGGEISEGLELIDAALAEGKKFRMVALADVPDEALLCTPYLLGSISDLEDPSHDHGTAAGYGRMLQTAYARLNSALDAPVYGTLACELGGTNTAVPFFLAAMQNTCVIDADPAGRAVPEITHSSYYLAGLPAAPIFAANGYDEAMVLDGIKDDARAETVLRALCQISQNTIAAIDHVLPAADLKDNLISGTLSNALKIGRLLREKKETPATLPQDIAQASGGWVAFEGAVTSSDWETEGGFTIGTLALSGQNADAGRTAKIMLKNENMVLWCDHKICATIPEIITLIDRDTGEVLTNPISNNGQNIAVLVLPAPSIFTTPKGLEIFGPKYIGLDQPFVETT